MQKPRFKARGHRSGVQTPEVSGQKPEVKVQTPDVRGHRSGIQTPEVSYQISRFKQQRSRFRFKHQRSVVRSQRSRFKHQMAEARLEVKVQTPEGRGEKGTRPQRYKPRRFKASEVQSFRALEVQRL